MLTLTTRGELPKKQMYSAFRRFVKYVTNVKYRPRRQSRLYASGPASVVERGFEYVAVFEGHKSGQAHIHLAVSGWKNAAAVRFWWHMALMSAAERKSVLWVYSESTQTWRVPDGASPGNVDLKGGGRNSRKIAGYLSKYLCKALKVKGAGHRYLCSQGLLFGMEVERVENVDLECAQGILRGWVSGSRSAFYEVRLKTETGEDSAAAVHWRFAPWSRTWGVPRPEWVRPSARTWSQEKKDLEAMARSFERKRAEAEKGGEWALDDFLRRVVAAGPVMWSSCDRARDGQGKLFS